MLNQCSVHTEPTKLFLQVISSSVSITLLLEVVLQYGAHVITAWGRCETVQKQQSGIPVQPLNVNSTDGNSHGPIHLVCSGHHKQ